MRNRRHAKSRKPTARFVGHDLKKVGITVRQMDDRHGQALHLDRIIVRIRHHPITLKGPHKHPDGAAALGKPDLRNRFAWSHHRNDAGPPSRFSPSFQISANQRFQLHDKAASASGRRVSGVSQSEL